MHSACMHAQDVRAANVKALTDGSLLALHRDDFDALLGSLSHIRHMWRFEALRKACAMAYMHACPYVACGPALCACSAVRCHFCAPFHTHACKNCRHLILTHMPYSFLQFALLPAAQHAM